VEQVGFEPTITETPYHNINLDTDQHQF